MTVGGAARAFAAAAVWRTTGARSAGRTLIHGLASDDETVRTVAGMLLVQGGRRALPLLREAAARREGLPMVLSVLADVGGPEEAPLLHSFTTDPDPDVSAAARVALEALAVNLDESLDRT